MYYSFREGKGAKFGFESCWFLLQLRCMVPTFVKLSGHQMGPTWKFHRKFTPEKVTQNPKGKDLSPNSQPSIFQGRGVKLRGCRGPSFNLVTLQFNHGAMIQTCDAPPCVILVFFVHGYIYTFRNTFFVEHRFCWKSTTSFLHLLGSTEFMRAILHKLGHWW